MKFYEISDTHFNHAEIATHCDRPKDFTKLLVRNIQNTVRPEDTVIHSGDVFIGPPNEWMEIRKDLPGTWWLIRGNHDERRTVSWWCEHGFAFCADAMIFRGIWFTHKPAMSLPEGCTLNIHGHLHNVWNGFGCDAPKSVDGQISKAGRLPNNFNRLFSVEYTDYYPIELNKFISHPDRYNARGPNGRD